MTIEKRLDQNPSEACGIIVTLDNGGTIHFTDDFDIPDELPAPGGLALMAAGAGGLLALRRRRRQSKGTSDSMTHC